MFLSYCMRNIYFPATTKVHIIFDLPNYSANKPIFFTRNDIFSVKKHTLYASQITMLLPNSSMGKIFSAR